MWDLEPRNESDSNATVSISYVDDYDDDYTYYQSVGFDNYIPKTINPGPWLLIITTIICLSTIYILPCIVIVGKRIQKRKLNNKNKENELLEINNNVNDDEEVATCSKFEKHNRHRHHYEEDENTKTTHNTHTKRSTTASSVIGSLISSPGQQAKSAISGVESAVYSTMSNGVGAVRRRRRHNRGGNRHFHKENKERKLLKCLQYERTYEKQQLLLLNNSEKKFNKSAAMRKKWSDVQSDFGPNNTARLSPLSSSSMQEKDDNTNNNAHHQHHRIAKSELVGGVTTSTPIKSISTLTSLKHRYPILHKRTPSPTQSYLSKIIDDISPNDAADANDPGIIPPCMQTTYTVDSTSENSNHSSGLNKNKEYSICCGNNALWHPKTIKSAWIGLVTLSEYDSEMSRLVKLTIPFAFNSIFEASMEVIFAIIIGKLMGTDALTTFVVVDIFLGTTSEFIGGIIDAQITLLSHAIGAGNNYLAGQYVQISTISYVLLQMPAILFWRYTIYSLIIWLGFDNSIATYAQQYANVAVFCDLVAGISEGIHSILEVTDHENFSAIMDFIQGILNLAIAFCLLYIKGPQNTTLMDLAYLDLIMEIIFTLITVIYCGFYRIWLKPFIPGMMKNFAFKNTVALKNVISTAVPLSIGSLLSYGEWEILTIFSAFMGPAEVTTWSILGTIWDTFEATTEGIGDAAEVRVAYHLGKGNPNMARLSSYKSVYIGVVISFIITSIFFMIGYDLPTLFTNDTTLILMINQLLPFIGIGNICMTFGLVCWALIGGQGRYKLATFIQFITSWGVTMPLAAFMTYVCNFNLKGITASVILGYMCTGSVMSFVILTSDWDGLSKVIMDLNAITGECESSDDEDSSSSSSSSNSSSSSSSSSSNSSSSSSNNDDILLAYRSIGTPSAISTASSKSSMSSSSSSSSSDPSSHVSSINPGSNSSGSYVEKMMRSGLFSSRSFDQRFDEEKPTPKINNVEDVLHSY